jgi:hypothetical protein
MHPPTTLHIFLALRETMGGQCNERQLLLAHRRTVEVGDQRRRACSLPLAQVTSGGRSDRIAVYGVSFGSYWATQLATSDDNVIACGVALVCHEPGCRTIFETASPTFKLRGAPPPEGRRSSRTSTGRAVVPASIPESGYAMARR